MRIAGGKTLFLLRTLLGVLSVASLLAALLAMLVLAARFAGELDGAKELLASLPASVVALLQLHWLPVAVVLVAALVLRWVCRSLRKAWTPAPEKLYRRFLALAQAGAVPEITALMEKIAAKRDWITTRELKILMRRYRAAVDRQQRRLNEIDRYPNNEKLWEHLDYV